MMLVKVSVAVAAFFAAPVMAGSKHKGAKSVKISEHLSKEASGKKAAMEVSSLGEIGKHDAALSASKVGHHSHKKVDFSFVEAPAHADCGTATTAAKKLYEDECKKADEIGTQADKDKYKTDSDAIKAAMEKDDNTAAMCKQDDTGSVWKTQKKAAEDLKDWCSKIKKDNTMLYAGIAAVVVIGGGAAFYVSQQKGGGGEEAY